MQQLFRFMLSTALVMTPVALNAQHCRKCGGNCSDSQKQTITVMTYNVGAFGKYMDDSEPLVAAIIRESGADLVSLNELDSCNTRCGLDSFPLRTLADDLGGWNFNFSRAMFWHDGAYGNGTVCSTRFHPVARYSISLPKLDGSETRSCSVMESDGFVFASTHLDFKGEMAPMEQARIITEWCTEKFGKSGKIVILCGDFNCTPNSSVIRFLNENWEIISPAETTFPASGACIDYIMVLKNGASYTVQESAVGTRFEAGDVYKASDHLPVKAVITF